MDKSSGVLKTSNSPNRALSAALGQLLEKGLVDAVMAPGVLEGSNLPMPMLFVRAEAMNAALPLAPAAGVSAAVQAARMGRGAKDKRLAVVLKPCEVRAVIELAKLHQTSLESLVLISMECFGRMENSSYLEMLTNNPDLPDAYLDDQRLQETATPTCLSCDAFEPVGADMIIHLSGMNVKNEIRITGVTKAGSELTESMGLEQVSSVPDQTQALSGLRKKRVLAKEKLFKNTRKALEDSDHCLEFLGNCLGCFNCRTACPVCYCRECVCARESFDRNLTDMLTRAGRSGLARLPGGLSMFHMTRLAHMSHACVGCGQCSSVCPSAIPVADLFRTLGADVQKALDYSPGRDSEEPIPYLRFKTEAGS